MSMLPITEERLQQAEALLAEWAQETTIPEDIRRDVRVTADDLPAAITALHSNGWGYLAAITGVDNGVDADLEALYHVAFGQAMVTLRVSVPRDAAVVPTVCKQIPSASFFERELAEMFGFTVTDTPNTDHLYLPDEWPQNTYPLRKDFDPSVLAPKASLLDQGDN